MASVACLVSANYASCYFLHVMKPSRDVNCGKIPTMALNRTIAI